MSKALFTDKQFLDWCEKHRRSWSKIAAIEGVSAGSLRQRAKKLGVTSQTLKSPAIGAKDEYLSVALEFFAHADRVFPPTPRKVNYSPWLRYPRSIKLMLALHFGVTKRAVVNRLARLQKEGLIPTGEIPFSLPTDKTLASPLERLYQKRQAAKQPHPTALPQIDDLSIGDFFLDLEDNPEVGTNDLPFIKALCAYIQLGTFLQEAKRAGRTSRILEAKRSAALKKVVLYSSPEAREMARDPRLYKRHKDGSPAYDFGAENGEVILVPATPRN